MLQFQIAWSYIKKYWGFAVIVVSAILLIIFKLEADSQLRRLQQELSDNEKRHQQELDDIRKAHDVENQEHDAHIKQLEDTLKQVEKQYEDAKSHLDDEKRAEIKQIIEEYSNDPNELAKKLSDATGIPIVIQ
jgi:hypothetical protein